jgi:hypothetical protein
MSGDAAVIRYGLPDATCRLCDRALDTDDQQVCKTYADDGADPFEADAFGVCPACRGEVAELVDTWRSVSEPPVDLASIATGYERVAGDCSFCARPVGEDAVTGIEYYRAGSSHEGGLADVRHFALCPHCVGVFTEFLDTAAG